MTGEKKCTKCGKKKPLDAFRRRYAGCTKIKRVCSDCRPPVDAIPQGSCKPLDPIDKIPCPRCHLRGHEAGDPDRCLIGNASAGLGSSLAGMATVPESHGGLRIRLEGMSQGRRVTGLG